MSEKFEYLLNRLEHQVQIAAKGGGEKHHTYPAARADVLKYVNDLEHKAKVMDDLADRFIKAAREEPHK